MMKQPILLLFIGLLIEFGAKAQQLSPVKWKYSAARVDSKTWEIHLTASMEQGWHIYSQYQPKEAIAVPTKIRFTKNPLIDSNGKISEVGKKEEQTIKELDIVQYQYAGTVDFVQKIVLKAPVQTTISGTVIFQVCTNQLCLPPKEEVFSVVL